MNLLFAYPVIIPTSSGGGDLPMEFVWATLIVINAIWLISFIVAKIHISTKNKGKERKKHDLSDIDYYFWTSGFGIIVDVIAIFIGLVYWVATLL